MLRKPLLTTHEVAVLLKATVRRWIRNGELPALNLGREWRISAIQLEEFLKVRSTVVPPASGNTTQKSTHDTESRDAAHARSKPKQSSRSRKSRAPK